MVKVSVPGADPAGILDRHLTCVGLCLLTLLLKSLLPEPVGFWPCSVICLVPWLVMVGGCSTAPRVYLYSFLLGLAFFLVNVRWLYPATREGYVAISVYLAAYFPLVACPVRSVVRRRHWRLAYVFPLVWVGSEMVRAVALTGFPWFFLGHAFHGVLSMIQISDLVGVYGVSFVVAALNGALADILLEKMGAGVASSESRRGRWRGLIFACCLLGVTLVYGQAQLRRDTTTIGPKIAILQGDYVNSAYEADRVSDREKMRTYLAMIDEAAQERPDLFLLPESPWPMVLNPESRNYHSFWRECFAALQERATRHDALLVTGSATRIETPHDLIARQRVHNSAMIFYPDGREPDRYDKVHLVPFGEYVPFRFGRFRALYFWLNSLMPFSGPDGNYEYSAYPGAAFKTFEWDLASPVRFAVPICYEDVMPYVSRVFVSGGASSKQADLLLNISNDGWFGRGVQQPQHLAVSVFRAVENRVGMARAVNTGVSAFITPNGRVYNRVETDESNRWGGAIGYAVDNVFLDSRYTLYSRFGDWFGYLCTVMWIVFFCDYWVVRIRTRRLDQDQESSS